MVSSTFLFLGGIGMPEMLLVLGVVVGPGFINCAIRKGPQMASDSFFKELPDPSDVVCTIEFDWGFIGQLASAVPPIFSFLPCLEYTGGY